jgi:hypothetical protein
MPAVANTKNPLASEAAVREEVRRFYDSVGWQRVGPGVFQNARYEDCDRCRRVHSRCRRASFAICGRGRYLLDAVRPISTRNT